eukprot:jgi/Ulvmu1/12119/UM084_0045.1
MYYDLFVGANGPSIDGRSSMPRHFDVCSKVKSMPIEDVRKLSGTGKAQSLLQRARGSGTQPSRVNIAAVESIDLTAPCTALAQKYQLVSVEPLDKKTLQLACTTLPVDIISLNLGPSSRLANVDGELLARAAARNVYIELQVAGVFESGRLEAAVAAVTTVLASKVPRHMVVISTGRGTSSSPSPGQLLSMATMLGMKRQHAVLAITHNAAALLKYAALRRLRGDTAVVTLQ